jgi:hypothetical protein
LTRFCGFLESSEVTLQHCFVLFVQFESE